jgi:hypothetical protein
VASRRHISLRKAFSKLEEPTQDKFTRRLTEGRFKNQYWETTIEAEQLRRPPGPGGTTGHGLPTNFALKTSGTTKARLVLDPSGALNQTLAKAPNREQTINKVMRRIKGTPVIFSMDIKEAFFCILLHEDSVNSFLF